MSKLKLFLIALSIPSFALAQECVLHKKTITHNRAVIDEIAQITSTVVPAVNGKRCIVNFRARIGATWNTGYGDYSWDGTRPAEEACALALEKGKDAVKSRHEQTQTFSDNLLVCNDQTDLATLKNLNPGTVAKLAQFRPHPKFLSDFWYNGTRCRWILDTNWIGNDVRTFQGIICHLQDQNWVVVDKF